MKEKVIAYLRDYYDLGNMYIVGDSKLTLDLGLSSFELLEMCCKLEELFKIEIDEEKMMQIKTIDDIVRLLEIESQ